MLLLFPFYKMKKLNTESLSNFLILHNYLVAGLGFEQTLVLALLITTQVWAPYCGNMGSCHV